MNKTIKQTERYEAPEIKVRTFVIQNCILQTSVGGNSIDDMEEKEIPW